MMSDQNQSIFFRWYVSWCCALVMACAGQDEPIDRKAVVNRHFVRIREVDTLNSLTLGNGRFAMTMDVTGLQSFPEGYENGVPLGTQSEWGWHSYPSTDSFRIEETLHHLGSHGRTVPYARQWPSDTRSGRAANYIRQNPHRIHLANVGWQFYKANGDLMTVENIENIDQTLDVWNGELISHFTVEGEEVEVISFVTPTEDQLAVRIKSDLLQDDRVGLTVNFPYPTDSFIDAATHFDPHEAERLTHDQSNANTVDIQRQLDTTTYLTRLSSSGSLKSVDKTEKGYRVIPEADSVWSFVVSFERSKTGNRSAEFEAMREQTHRAYHQFWNSGGMIDFGKVSDSNAFELERRMILSLYLTKVNCGGKTPPQETGLTYNSWYGKPHMEMAWWHGVHFALWGRPEILEDHMEWYSRSSAVAKRIAERQGFTGIRWQKMTDNEGRETASSVGSYLLWQQPHIIYFAELIYRSKPDRSVLEKYAGLVEQTAEFMADFASYDSSTGRYILGPGVIPAQERFDPAVTFNPTYELAYWRWGLETAQQWRMRLGKSKSEKWDVVLAGLSSLPKRDNIYLPAESATDAYSTELFMTDHPSVLGAYGMLPATEGLDKEVMGRTLDFIWKEWRWNDTWGWDFPMTAMTATRLNKPEQAIEALMMPVTTNTYLRNGHNYQDERLRLYLPGNGGLLIALAMMTAGTDETTKSLPGFPDQWDVRYEGIRKMP